MKIPFKYFFYFILLLGLILGAAYMGFKFSLVKQHTEIKQEALLEKVETVVKLGTVEGVISEIFQYSDFYNYDISPFRKKALIKIRARVLVGYDLDSLDIDVNSISGKVTISNLPGAQILSIDHELDYYDITEGTFNSFTKEDYNMLQQQAKEFIRKKANESDLFDRADKQLNEQLKLLNWLLADNGWEIVVKDDNKKRLLN